ncbi:MAG: hypothetical protein V1722_03010 [Candidatus Micrarchaeota archaeon]
MNRLYSCRQCGLEYREHGIAMKCEAYCKKHNAQSPEITKYAVQ